ncbi:MIF-like protein mif-2 [Mytilus edulis]|uniref:MIF-like protein mif-2 n=1 Tax=Mytilus edulis TaxID=6550 RepID=UPI0039EE54D3
MPKIIIHTNLKDEDIPAGFEHKVAEKVSEVVNYSTECIYVSITRGDRMSHNGSSAPMAFIDMMTCARFNEKNNPGYSRQFLKFFCKELRLPLSRVLIQYHDAQIHDFGCIRQPPEYKVPEAFHDSTTYKP